MFRAKKITLFLTLLFFLGAVFTPFLTTQAASPFSPDNQVGVNEVGKEAYGQSSDPKDPRIIISNIIKIALEFLAIIFLVMIIWSGFEWMTAGGNEEKVGQAKKRLRNSVIGLVIILMAYAITYFVTEQVINAANQSWEW